MGETLEQRIAAIIAAAPMPKRRGVRKPLERFMEKVQILPSGCWRWAGKIHRSGYGLFSVGHARHTTAHRWLYQQLHGPLAAAVDLDHLCRNRWCVRPSHVEPVTRRENLLRGETLPAGNVRKTHCPQGHPYDEENTYEYRGARQCLSCRRARDSARVR